MEDIGNGGKFLYPVMQEEHLAAPVELVVDDALDFVLVKEDNFRLDGNAVGRRCLDDGQVAGAQKRKLQRTRDGRCRERKGIHRMLELAQLFLGTHAEFLFFVNNQQAQVLEFEAVGKDFVRAYQNVYLPFFQAFFDVRQLFGAAQAAHVFHRARKVGEAGLEGLEMLQRKDGGGHQHCHLFGVRSGLECGPDGNFRFSKSYVTTHQPVHGAGIFHILFDGLGGTLLIRGVFVHEGRFQLLLQVGVRRKSKTFGSAALGIELDEFLGDILYARLGRLLHIDPDLGTQFVHARRLPFLGTETGYLVQRMDRHEHYVTPAVEQFHYLVYAAFVVLHLYQAAKDTHAMVDVHHKIAYVEGAEVVHRELLALFHRPSHAYAVEAVKNLVVRVQAHAVFMVDKAAVDVPALHEFRQQGMLFL